MSASFYDLLKYAKTGIASPDMTYYDKLRASTLMGGVVKTLTGQPPLTFKADGTPLISWSMLGNGEQTGTPTPDNPIMPEFVGVRTGNLWNEEYPNISGTIRYIPLYVGEGSFTLSTTTPYDSSVANLFLLSGNVSTGASTSGNGAWKNHNVTAQSDSGYVTIAYRHYTGTTSPADCKTMLNLGSTALPYEPFGWAEKITCAGQTVPVYLGQTQTVRRIKKQVLTGAEQIGYVNNCFTMTFDGKPVAIQPIKTVVISNVYQGREPVYRNQLRNYQCCITRNYNQLAIRDDNYTEIADYQSYLATQYAAGTPVVVWYVLDTPETAIVNEPLAKIGDYADELSSEDAAVTIPTIRGQNTLTVDTTLPPSGVSITGKIKPI